MIHESCDCVALIGAAMDAQRTILFCAQGPVIMSFLDIVSASHPGLMMLID